MEGRDNEPSKHACKFSIIIPAYNSQDTIDACVKSIVDQKDVDIQIIIVENGSTDKTLSICNELQGKYNNVEIYVSDVSNVSLARNIGLRHATGDVISFCDADDYLLPDSLSKVSEIFEKSAVQVVCTGVQIKIDDLILERVNKREETISSSKMIEYILCNPNTMGSVCNKFFRKELIENVEFRADLTYMEDIFFNVEVLSQNRNAEVYISPVITYCYVHNDDSATNNYSKLFDDKSNLKYLNALNKIMTDLPLSDKENEYVKDGIYRLVVETMWNKEINKTELQSRFLREEIKKTWFVFVRRVFKFELKHRVKLLVKGIWILLISK